MLPSRSSASPSSTYIDQNAPSIPTQCTSTIMDKIIQVMTASKLNRDIASIALYKNKDNLNDTVFQLIDKSLTSQSLPISFSKNYNTTSSSSSTQSLSTVSVIFDSGVRDHYVREGNEPFVLNVQPNTSPLVTLPDATQIQSTKKICPSLIT